jgi:hypothetical protein
MTAMRSSSTWGVLALLVLSAAPCGAQPSPRSDDVGGWREVVAAQQRQLDEQRQLLERLQETVIRQGRDIAALRDGGRPGTPAPIPSGPAGASESAAAVGPAEQAAPAAAQQVNATQEIAREAPQGPALDVGPVQMRVGGYLALTGTYRSTNSGGNVGTSFGSIPFADIVEGNVSETRFSAQSTRLSLRVDAPMPPGAAHFSKLAGYVEMDFAGSTPGTVAVSSSSVGFRLRQAFGEVAYRNALSLGVGQAFSLMTPPKGQLSMWPADHEILQVVDTNYVAGLVWSRLPQLRVTWRPSSAFNWALSVENPEQQLGRGLVTLHACCADDLDAQYNTGSDELKVPNLMPDIATRVALNRGQWFHADLGGVLRVLRHSLAPYDRDEHEVGGGLSANVGLWPASGTRIVAQGSWGAGMGRYIGGLVPDVVVMADGSISPVRTATWVAGIEQRASPRLSLAGYFSGVHASRNAGVDAGGTLIGYGFAGAPATNNRSIREATGVIVWQAVKTPDRGSVQVNAQGSWLSRSPWWRGTGPPSADAFLFLAQIRYNLP